MLLSYPGERAHPIERLDGVDVVLATLIALVALVALAILIALAALVALVALSSGPAPVAGTGCPTATHHTQEKGPHPAEGWHWTPHGPPVRPAPSPGTPPISTPVRHLTGSLVVGADRPATPTRWPTQRRTRQVHAFRTFRATVTVTVTVTVTSPSPSPSP
ncbi:hypothetical protein ACIOWG_10305 [Streptomyces sp. NPDC087658]|uniref:hypothetical protein n=1 Tax=Streptomyces sp. NPDC087658 TaxID=3365800 RepID=UPI00381BB1B2